MSRKWMWVLAAFIATILLAYTIYRSEKAEDDRICRVARRALFLFVRRALYLL